MAVLWQHYVSLLLSTGTQDGILEKIHAEFFPSAVNPSLCFTVNNDMVMSGGLKSQVSIFNENILSTLSCTYNKVKSFLCKPHISVFCNLLLVECWSA